MGERTGRAFGPAGRVRGRAAQQLRRRAGAARPQARRRKDHPKAEEGAARRARGGRVPPGVSRRKTGAVGGADVSGYNLRVPPVLLTRWMSPITICLSIALHMS